MTEIDQILCEKIKSLPQEKQNELLADVELATLAMQVIPPIQGVPIGTILAYAGLVSGTAPLANAGWLICNGDEINRQEYPELFNVIGTLFGGGNSTSTYNLPDLRGRFLRGVDHGVGRDPDAATRTASASGGITGDNVGSLQEDEFKEHTHKTQEIIRGPGFSGDYWSFNPSQTGPAGGKETRPKNIYVNWIIKAKNVS
ncbi:phage tail protein [Dapis sp. BLCC M229]|uniref:phage tail protein n=1 Tax=Dapis sp. BLCC M229 TaxID=3400188 RepID=UPI003CE94FDB